MYPHNHLCRTRKQKNSSIKMSLDGILRAVAAAVQPGRWYGSSRSLATSSQATQQQGIEKSGPASDTRSNPQRIATSNPPAGQTSINMPQMNESFVLFGVKGTRRTLELAQINVRKCMNDDALFGDMRNRYRELRGFLRYWFSIWRFSHCDFVKVDNLRVVSLEAWLTNFSVRKDQSKSDHTTRQRDTNGYEL